MLSKDIIDHDIKNTVIYFKYELRLTPKVFQYIVVLYYIL